MICKFEKAVENIVMRGQGEEDWTHHWPLSSINSSSNVVDHGGDGLSTHLRKSFIHRQRFVLSGASWVKVNKSILV